MDAPRLTHKCLCADELASHCGVKCVLEGVQYNDGLTENLSSLFSHIRMAFIPNLVQNTTTRYGQMAYRCQYSERVLD